MFCSKRAIIICEKGGHKMKTLHFSINIMSLLCLSLAFAGCAQSHEHLWVLEGDTATCEKNGTLYYSCSICKETKTEISPAKGHKWMEQECTATCTADGVTTSKCEYCGEIKKENTKAKGHEYGKQDVCSDCLKYKYNISWAQTEQTDYAKVSSVNFMTSGDCTRAFIEIYTAQTGDALLIGWLLKDSNGNKIRKCSFDNGDFLPPAFELNSHYAFGSFDIVELNKINVNDEYKLEISYFYVYRK